MRIIRANELKDMLGVSRSTIWRWSRKGLLPAPRQVGPNVVGWYVEDIDMWRQAIPKIGA